MINGKRTTASPQKLGVDLRCCGGFWQRVSGSCPHDRSPDIPSSGFGKPRCLVHRLGSQEVAPRSRQRRLGTGTAEFAGETHVGYGKLDFPALNLTVVGSRPFSWVVRFGKMPILSRAVRSNEFKESTVQIVAAKSAAYETLIF